MTEEFREAAHIIAWVLGALVGLPVALLVWAWQIQAVSDYPVIYALCWVTIVGSVLILARKLHCLGVAQFTKAAIAARADYEHMALDRGDLQVWMYGQFPPKGSQ